MRTQRHFGRLAVFLVLALVSFQEALARPPVWKNQPTEDRAGTGEPYRHDLMTDLADDGGGPVFFFPADTRMPSWLHIDSRRYLTADTGHPALTDTGVFSFDIKATPDPNGDGGILTTFVLTVVGNPDCNGLTEIDMGSSPEDTAFNPLQVADVCQDPAAGGSLTFELTGTPPSWLRLSAAGVLSGTAPWSKQHTEVKLHTGFEVKMTTSSGGTLSLPVKARVTKFFKAPRWTKNPINNLPDATDDKKLYQVDLSAFVENPEGTPLTYSIVQNAPSGWVKVNAGTGLLSGNPTFTDDASPLDLIVRVATTDPDNAANSPQADTHVQFNVVHVKQTPICQAGPIVLPDTFINPNPPYQQDLSGLCSDPGGDELTYSFTQGPQWATVSGIGLMTGVPKFADLGHNQWTLQATNGAHSATVVVTVEVKKRPTKWKQNPIQLAEGLENVAVDADLNGFVDNPDGGPYECRLVGSSTWATVTKGCRLTGTPKVADIGDQSFQVEVTDMTSPADTTVVKITIKPNHPPVCAANAITLTPNAKERSPYVNSVTGVANDPTYPTSELTFAKEAGPTWMTIAADGTTGGTPARTDVAESPESFTVRVTNPLGQSCTGVVKVNVDKVPRPPVCTPASLASIARQAFTGSIAANAVDQDNEVVTFTKKSGPAWLTGTTDGALSGTPSDQDQAQSPQAFVFTATNASNLSCDVNVSMKIDFNPHPIVPNPSAMVFTMKERQTLTENLADAGKGYITNPDNYPLTCQPVDSLDFVQLTGDCHVTLSPKNKDIGQHKFKFTVSGGPFQNVPGEMTINVERDPQDPVWTPDAFTIVAQVGRPFADTLVGRVKELDGYALTYALQGCPAWLQASTAGALSGTPQQSDLGTTTCSAVAANPYGKSKAAAMTVKVTMLAPNPTALTFDILERQTLNADLAGTNPQYIINPDGYALTCKLVDTRDFVALSGDCKLALAPKNKDIGQHRLRFTFSGGPFTDVPAEMVINVGRDPQTPVWNPNTFVFNARAGKPFADTFAGKAADPDGYPLTFTAKGCPAWFKVNASTGAISGTPADADAGTKTCQVNAANPYGKSADANVTIKVILLRWTQNPIQLHDGRVLEVYEPIVNLKQYVVSGDAPELLKFSRTPNTGGAPWVPISTDGNIAGTPQASDQGLNQFSVRVTDSAGIFEDVTVRINVLRPFVAPSWKTPIVLPDATETQPYATSLAPFIVNPDNMPITCSGANGPAWLTVNADCTVSGTPQKGDKGNYTVSLTVSDGKHTPATALASGKVLPLLLPPEIKPLNFVVDENISPPMVVDLKDPQYLSSPNENDKLSCSLISAKPDWLTLSADCVLTMSPKHKDINKYALNIRVFNSFQQKTDGVLNVEVRRKPQPIQCQDPIEFNAKATQPFTGTLADKCKELDNVSLDFSSLDVPAWLRLDKAGNLTGTPQETNVGDHTFTVTAKADILSASFKVIVHVKTSIVPPDCQDPISLPNAIVSKAYLQNLSQYCTDPLGGSLSYEKLTGPGWAFFTGSGGVIGTPAQADIGIGTYTVRVKNAKGSKDITVYITVEPLPDPSWKQDPINLGEQLAEQLFRFDLNPYVENPGGGPLTFRKEQGPNWLIASADGKLSGTPKLTDVGEYTAVFSVSSGGRWVTVGAFGKVVKHDPPQIGKLEFTVKVRETLDVNLNGAPYVTSPSGDSMTFSIPDAQPWVSITTAGAMTAKPTQIGDYTFTLVVVDSHGAKSQAPLIIHAIKNSKPPECPADALHFTARVNQPFQETLTKYITDPSGTGLTFRKSWDPNTGNPANIWLSVSTAGTMTGSPKTANVGDEQYMMTAVNGDGDSCDVTVFVAISPAGPTSDTIVVDDKVPGAQAENLWLLDSAQSCGKLSPLMKSFISNMNVYFDALDVAEIQHTGVYVSSNPTKGGGAWKSRITGQPIPSRSGETLLTWNENNIEDDFTDRIKSAQACPCYNSPIWAQHLFYTQWLKTMPEYQHSWFLPKVPMDTMIITDHADYFRDYSKGTAQASWQATDYADAFTTIHTEGEKSYRINVIAPKCLKTRFELQSMADATDDGEPPVQDLSETPYQALVGKTGGSYWKLDCKLKMATALQQFAEQVKFRAYVQAKRFINLTKTPVDPSKIEVFLSGNRLAPSLWRYDAGKNAVELFWDKIDMSTVKPGDRIEIKYEG